MVVTTRIFGLAAIFAAALAVPTLAENSTAGDTVQAVIDTEGKQRVEIVGGSYFFEPRHIIVKVNIPTELSVRRESGIVPHTFVMKIPEAGVMIDETLSTDAKTFVFTPVAVGKYTFYCRNKLLFFKSHQEKGMEGVLEVVP
jgi:plastocyanin domain-containing protein